MMIESLNNVSIAYADKPVLNQINWVVEEKQKWGVVGLNGAGKSTLLKIMAGVLQPDSGEVFRLKKYRVSYCPQTMEFAAGHTVYQTVSAQMKESTEVYQIKAILNKLGINQLDEPIETLSGGQKKRVALAIALIRQADLYLLDEPTNHLDQDMILWLEKFLIHVNKAVVLVTHDRYFLSRITNHIAEISHGRIYCYDGGYADFLEQREIRRQQARASEQKRQNFLRSEIEWIRAGAQARSTKQKSRIERYKKIAAMQPETADKTLNLDSAVSRLGRNTIRIDHISKAYDGHVLFKDFSYEVERMDRVGIIGPNGCGKTTLLKTILGQVKPDTGTIQIGSTVKIGYFAQQNEVFEKDQRVLEYLESFGAIVYDAQKKPIRASEMLEEFLFDREKQNQLISHCSGGEKRRLYLCSILMQAPNILLLDEPTNDLDTDTLTALEDYLENFAGAVLAVSHDRYFLDRMANRLFAFEDHAIRVVQETYSDYLEQRDTEKEEAPKAHEIKRARTSNRLSYNEQMELQRLNEQLPQREQEVSSLETALSQATEYPAIKELSEQLNQKKQELEEAEERWLALSERSEA